MLHFDLQLFGGSGASLGKRNRLKQITIAKKNGVSSTYREYKGNVYEAGPRPRPGMKGH